MAYPLYFLGYSAYANPFIGLITATVFAILLTIILAWLRLSTRSVWSSSLAHAGTNMVLATLSTALLVGGANKDSLGGQRPSPKRLARGHLRLDHTQRTTQGGQGSRSKIRLDEAWVGSSESGTATRYPTLAGPI
jgi:hypothetical protein